MADSNNNRIQKIQPDGNVTVIGHRGSAVGEFYRPSGVALDSKDNLYVADTYNNRIQKIHLDGNITVIGSFNLSQKIKIHTYFGPEEFIRPSGVALDSKDNLYVADTGNNRIQVFNNSENFVKIIRQNSLIKFSEPSGVALDSKDNLYVADTGNNRIQVFNIAGEFNNLKNYDSSSR